MILQHFIFCQLCQHVDFLPQGGRPRILVKYSPVFCRSRYAFLSPLLLERLLELEEDACGVCPSPWETFFVLDLSWWSTSDDKEVDDRVLFEVESSLGYLGISGSSSLESIDSCD